MTPTTMKLSSKLPSFSNTQSYGISSPIGMPPPRLPAMMPPGMPPLGLPNPMMMLRPPIPIPGAANPLAGIPPPPIGAIPPPPMPPPPPAAMQTDQE